MAEEQKTPENDKGNGSLTIGELRTLIADTVKGIVGGGGDDKGDDKKEPEKTTPTSGGGIAAEVARQVEKIRAREAREKRDADVDGKLKELSERVAEKPPVERRKVHKLMGWGD